MWPRDYSGEEAEAMVRLTLASEMDRLQELLREAVKEGGYPQSGSLTITLTRESPGRTVFRTDVGVPKKPGP